MNKFFTFGVLFFSATVFSQVGINTMVPKATFEVMGSPDDHASADGIIAPRISGNELFLKNNAYGIEQQGVLIYVSVAATGINLTDDTLDVTEAGYYYHNGVKWLKVSASNGGKGDWSLAGNNTAGIDFIGTTNDFPLNIKIDDKTAGYIGKNGTSIGYLSGASVGNRNSGFGTESLSKNVTGSFNAGFGTNTLRQNTTGANNNAMGTSALINNISGDSNTAFGNNSLITNVTGNGNIGIGHQSDVTQGNFTNAIAIGWEAKVGASNSMSLGGTGVRAVNVGINTSTPAHKLHVVGSGVAGPVRFEGLQNNASNTKVVMVDASGILQTRDTTTLLPKITAGYISASDLTCTFTGGTGANNCPFGNFTFSVDRKSLVTIYIDAKNNQMLDKDGNVPTDTFGRYYGANLYDISEGGNIFQGTGADIITSAYMTGRTSVKIVDHSIREAGTYTYKVDVFVGGGSTSGAQGAFSNNSTYIITTQPVQ